MIASSETVSLMDALLVVLALPLSAAEQAEGWAAESKQAATKYFVDVRQKLNSGEPLPPLDIVRGLDHWGVTGGNLLEEIARVSNALRREAQAGS